MPRRVRLWQQPTTPPNQQLSVYVACRSLQMLLTKSPRVCPPRGCTKHLVELLPQEATSSLGAISCIPPTCWVSPDLCARKHKSRCLSMMRRGHPKATTRREHFQGGNEEICCSLGIS